MLGLRDQLGTTWGVRVRAFAGLWLLLGGLLAALGLTGLVLTATIVVLVVGGVAGVAFWLGRGQARRRVRLVVGQIGPAGRRFGARVDGLELPRRFGNLAARGRSYGSTARKTGVAAATVASRRSARRLRELGARSQAALRAGASELSHRSARISTPAPPDPANQANRLNTLGAQLRREGKHERAVEQHRAALAIVRDLGDERTEALTLNNLALAVAHTDGVDAAVQHFEQALVVLRQLGDDEHEGHVIANLGFIHKSHGRSEEAEGYLHAALGKLPADSRAYRKVEEQLRQAS